MTLYEAIEKQIILEVGQDVWADKLLPEKEIQMLAQKFGLKIPLLIQSEMYLVHREEQRARDARVRKEWK